MSNKVILITGSDGLIGSEAVKFYSKKGYSIIGIDNNSRKKFFGEDASVLWNRKILKEEFPNYKHLNLDIRNTKEVFKIFDEFKKSIKLIIHTAAQPSHDWAATNPVLDFQINAMGTQILLEATRKYCKEAPFIFTSTNKVYGDRPNDIKFNELKTRYQPTKNSEYILGVNENMSIDQSVHSVFGASKVAADIMVQEYGKYFSMNTVAFRGGCLTGSNHSGTKLHGFLSYLMKCVAINSEYTIFGYKGKQVRDNIHSEDLINAFDNFFREPKQGEVYNIGGGLESNCSMLEAIEISKKITGNNFKYKYSNLNRIGDHKWYVSDLSKFKKHYPKWKLNYNIEEILYEIYEKNILRWKKEL
jgi:CDP-paratose 2-epimerase